MTSSFHRIDLVEVLEQYHQQQQPIVPPKRRQQNQQRYQSFDVDIFMDDDDDNDNDDDDDVDVDDNVSTVSFMTTSGWDQTIMDQDVDALVSWQQRQARGRFMTPHAVAVQTWVYGIQDRPFMEGDQDNNNNNNSIKDNNNNLQIRWKTSLAPHRIFQIASNENGTVIAATTDNGAITILRGRDGKVLASRRLTTSITMALEGGKNNSPLETTTTNLWCPHVSFIQSVVQNHTRTDALLVQLPSSHQPPILVSNIQGDRLNDENDAVVAQATQSMNLDTIQLPTISTKNVVLMEGYVHYNNNNNNTRPRKQDSIQDENDDSTAQTFRFVVIHEATTGNTEKCLALAEYDLATRECRLVSKNVTVGPNGSGWEINERIGLHIKPLSGHGKYVLALVAQCYNSPPKTYSKILWLDPDDSLTQYCPSTSHQETVQAKLIGEYSLHQDPAVGDSDSRGIDNSTEMRVLSLNFVHSCDTDTATALAISIQQGNQSITQILQAQILLQPSDPSPELYNLELGPVHLLYNIPIPASIQTMTACSVNATTFGPYSFRAKVSSGWNVPEDMFVFQTASISNEKRSNCCDASSIGSIRLHTVMNKFEHARSLVHSAGMETLLQDKYANFHPAEIALQKLKHSLLESSPGDQGMNEALVALERGAGHVYGQRAFLDAADVLLRWPAPNLGSTCAPSMPTFRDHIQGLSMFINTMKNVSDVFSDEDTPSSTRSSFQLKLSNLENKLCAVKYLGDEVCRAGEEVDTQQSKLPLQFAFVTSMDDLFVAFLKNEDFNQAEKMLRCYARSMLSLERIVDAFLQLPSEIHPRNYIYLLKDFVLPSLSINHELLPRILTWSSSKADDLDDESDDGIDDAIELLETIEQATKKLRRKVHDSFAYHSPFVEQPSTMDSKNFLPSLNGKKSLGESSSGIFSSDGSAMSDISMVTFEKEGGLLRNDLSSNICPHHTVYNTSTRPNPTILEIGRMKRGAQKTRGSSKVPIISRDDTIDENEESVEAKLEAARWLKEARSLGISRTLVTLRDFVFRGGATFLCNELIQFFSLQAMSHEQRYSNLHTKVLGFCKRARVPFDDALKNYAKRLCEGKSASPEAIEEAASVARCCQTPTTKCQLTLTTLQSALFCRFSPAWLTKLSRDAIEWSAGDSSLRSELEEASRLLLIDEIVGRYCGNGAKELFHVDNPVHASRLLEFVCNNLKKESVLSDVLDLCEAFHHLSVEDGCGLLLQNTILGGNQEQASKILEELYRRNKGTAHQVYSRAVTFCIDLVDDYTAQLHDYCGLTQELDGSESDSLRHDLMAYTSCALTLTKVALSQSRFMLSGNAGSGFTSTHFNVEHLEDLSRKLERVKTLQSDFRIFLRISDLDRPEKSVEVVTRILSDIVDPYEIGERDEINKVASLARRVCSLLATDSLNETKLLFSAAINPARELALTSGGLKSLNLFSDLGISETSGCEVASRCCMSLSMTLCMRSTQKKDSLSSDQLCSMKGVAMAASLLQDYALPKCEVDVLGSATSLSCLIDLISQVLFRADEGCGEQLDFFRKKLLANAATKESSVASCSSSTNCVQYLEELANIRAPSFHPTWYVGDGLLLPRTKLW
ncbi:hypothetical protein IV203_035860 [Nitzschia inconspicua]|uniref:Uncharacterized protein n=1 Tax=Nitzschia inconspicua TaxID=303405 RepID=A0A9K3PVE1_9STRA|nr:hypothetical protein IV203_035860 [Nitzschia inconspicua]